ncbi:integrase_H2C2 domain-containing protein [Trichonephila clavipes]|nr:integrase_H2C2 domain-containing protein [Trichonephila clavipes]
MKPTNNSTGVSKFLVGGPEVETLEDGSFLSTVPLKIWKMGMRNSISMGEEPLRRFASAVWRNFQKLKSSLHFKLQILLENRKKFGIIAPIVRQVTTPSTSALDPWSDESIRKGQLADPEIKPILEFKEFSDEKPSWRDISYFHPTTKRYWALWDSLHLRNGILYRKVSLTMEKNPGGN